MAVQFWNNVVLFVSGLVAMDPACCCTPTPTGTPTPSPSPTVPPTPSPGACWCLYHWEVYWDCTANGGAGGWGDPYSGGATECVDTCAPDSDWQYKDTSGSYCFYTRVTCEPECTCPTPTPTATPEPPTGTPTPTEMPTATPTASPTPTPAPECPDGGECTSCGSYTVTASGVTGSTCSCINGIDVGIGRVSTCAYSGDTGGETIPCDGCPGGVMLFVSYGLDCEDGVWTLSVVAPCVSTPGCQGLTWTKTGGCPDGHYTGANGTVDIA